MKKKDLFNQHISTSAHQLIAFWLLSGAFLIFLMVVIGGITRLTGSGLSITEWKPIMGAIPPLNEAQWEEAFEKYQQIPQFQKLNYHFTLSDFKEIFFWEYLHRLIGRLIGVVFLGGFFYFLWKKQLSKEWIKKTLFLFALGGLQGFIGWYMVSSGLVERTSVSHYRLAIHLITAFITFGFTIYFAMQLLYPVKGVQGTENRSILNTLYIVLSTVILQIIYGAFVAGLHAGKIANTFPTMDGEWIPSALFYMQPAYLNFFENLITVQFIHRVLAWIILILITVLFFTSRKKMLTSFQKRSIQFCFLAVMFQFLLGVITILYKDPVPLAVLHQIGGFVLFTAVVIATYAITGKQEREWA